MVSTRIGKSRIVGLIPAAGIASRLGPLPCSKEIYPVGFHNDPVQGLTQRVACDTLLDAMTVAGTQAAYFVIRSGKWDIPHFLSRRSGHGLPIAYVVTVDSPHTPFSVDCAYPFLSGADVLLGFPDVLFEPVDAFTSLVRRKADTDADVVLGLFPSSAVHKMDVVHTDEDGAVLRLEIKPAPEVQGYAWLVAAWSPTFTEFLHAFVAGYSAGDPRGASETRELYVGDVIQSAIDDGLSVDSVRFPEGICRDIGTPEDLRLALVSHAESELDSLPRPHDGADA